MLNHNCNSSGRRRSRWTAHAAVAAVAATLLLAGQGASLALADAPTPADAAEPAAPVATASSQGAAPEGARTTDPMDSVVPGIFVHEKAGQALPDLPFFDEYGNRVTLHQFLGTKKPIILTLNYYRCPMLCDMVLNGVGEAIAALPLVPGEDYEIVTLSIDPAETPSLARQKKARYIDALQKDGIEEGWHFLTGEQHDIEAVAAAIGYGYRWVESKKQYAHPAVITLINPDGTISRYLYGHKFKEQTLRLSLVEAADGKIGTTLDRFLLTCLHYDSSAGKYSPAAMALMRIGGVLTVGLVLLFIAGFLGWEYYNRRHDGDTVRTDSNERA